MDRVDGHPVHAWIWNAPISRDELGVAIVMDHAEFESKFSLVPPSRYDVEEILKQAYMMADDVLGPDARMMPMHGPDGHKDVMVVRSRGHRCRRLVGPGWMLAGDSAASMDAFFSSGVHLAAFTGMMASAAINSVVQQKVSEEEAFAWYEHMVLRQFTRLQWIISSALHKMGLSGCTDAEKVRADMHLAASDDMFGAALPLLGIRSFATASVADVRHVMDIVYDCWEYFSIIDVPDRPDFRMPPYVHPSNHSVPGVVLALVTAHFNGGFTDFFGDLQSHALGLQLDPLQCTVGKVHPIEQRIVSLRREVKRRLLTPIAGALTLARSRGISIEGWWRREVKTEDFTVYGLILCLFILVALSHFVL